MKNKNGPSKVILSRILTVLMLGLSTIVLATEWDQPQEIKNGYALQVELIDNPDGTLSLFYIEPDGEVMYRKQDEPNGATWSSGKSLGIYANQIKLGKHRDGRIEVFAIGTLGNIVTHIGQTISGGDEWTKEIELKSVYATQIEVTEQPDGTMMLFTIKPDREVAYLRQVAPDGEDWTKSRSLGSYANQIALAKNMDGRIDVFIIGTLAGVMSHQTQLTPNSDDWSKEKDIKGLYAQQIETAANMDGTISLFFIQPDREIAYIRQLSPGSEEWTQRKKLDIYGNLIEVGKNSAGQIELIIVGTLGNVLTHINQTTASGNDWSKEVEFKKSYGRQMRLSNNADGRLQLVYIAALANALFSTSELKPAAPM